MPPLNAFARLIERTTPSPPPPDVCSSVARRVRDARSARQQRRQRHSKMSPDAATALPPRLLPRPDRRKHASAIFARAQKTRKDMQRK